jgi:hypothetical protein
MSTVATAGPPAVETPEPRAWSSQRLARTTGTLIVLLAGLGIAGPLTLESLLVPGDAAATAANLAAHRTLFTLSLAAWVAIVVVDVAISVLLFLLLAPAGRGLSLSAMAMRLVYSATVAALLAHLFAVAHLVNPPGAVDRTAERQALVSLETFSAGFLAALVFFGAHLTLLGILFVRSRYIPRILAGLLVAAGVGYVVDSLASLMVDGYGGYAALVFLAPAVAGEVGLALWLLVRGVRT